jgi:hypothetical protein
LPFHKFVATLFRVKGAASGRIASKGKCLTTASAFGGDNEKGIAIPKGGDGR